MAADPIDFWFTMGSTYTYLSVMRLGELQRSSGIRFRWRPYGTSYTTPRDIPEPDSLGG